MPVPLVPKCSLICYKLQCLPWYDFLVLTLFWSIILGGIAQVELEVRKPVDGSGYTLQFKIGTLNVNNFLAHFRVEASEVISSDLSFASSRMGLATLIMQDAKMTGLFSPGGGVEIVATGRITAPELPADASRFYIVIQDFQEGSSDSVDEGYGKPIAAIFAIFSK